MKLILLFGPPAVGKLTVAKELAKLTSFTLFHNHIVLNAVTEIFDFNTDARRRLESEFRQRIVEEATLLNKDLIMTGAIMRDNKIYYNKVIHTKVDPSVNTIKR